MRKKIKKQKVFWNKLFLIIPVVSLFIIILFSNCKKKDSNWTSIFNGENLDGWIVKIKGYPLNENIHNTFRVEEGVLKVSYDGYNDQFNNSFGHIIYKQPFSNYKFRMEYRFTGDQIKDGAGWATRNSGVMIHGQSPESMELNQDFPISIEVQLLGGLGTEDRSTANLCTPGTHVIMDGELFTPHCTTSSSKTFHGDQWVRLEIEVYNDSLIKHKINGELVLSYTNPQIGGGNVKFSKEILEGQKGNPLKGGYISLQSESHPVEFRNIEILEL